MTTMISGMTTRTTDASPGVKMEYELVLQHHGIKGMRWGIRRFQNKNGGLTPAGRKRYAKNQTDDADDKDNQSAKTSGESKPEESYEDRKARAIKSGNAKEVLEFKGDLTPQQRKEAYDRIQWEQNMNNLAPKDVDAGKAQADKFFKNVDTVTGYANTAAKAWNTFANFYNAFSDKDVSLPKIDTDLTKGNRNTRREEKKRIKAKEDEARQKAAGGES